jgi:hypothetical protein
MNSGARVAAVALAALLGAGCGLDGALHQLRTEPLLEAPPGAVELLRTDQDGTSFGFGTPARVEILWGVPDEAAALEWYLAQHGDTYGLRGLGLRPRWSGSRTIADMGVVAVVAPYASLADVAWQTMIGVQEEAAAWDGALVLVRVSSTGP